MKRLAEWINFFAGVICPCIGWLGLWRFIVVVLQDGTVDTITFWLSAKPEFYRMKQVVADLMYQILVELLSQILMRLAEWLAAATWL
ncbi:hypothetical protein [Pseudomonas rhizophila]|uniref:Uncharacterized protein n=1 Tax=Pseudomonas rhizophila TaxID=2045200 RepID=A0ABM6UI92_9PSED|nr:hypothetical protein [Pseudomonas rhizophila]AVU77106.1 hypothetical protein CRX69_18600 [Pseudomonas rhizophila]